MTSTRDLSALAGGQESQNILASNRLASNLGNSSALQIFGTNLMELLKRYQSLGTAKFSNAQFQGQEEQAGRVLAESEAGMPPSLQAGVRSAQEQAIQPQITGAGQMQQTFAEQIRGIGGVIEQARALGDWLTQQEENKRKNLTEALFTVPQAFQATDEKTQAEYEKTLGLPKGFIKNIPIKQQEAETKVVGKSLLEKDPKTGQWRVIYTEPETEGMGNVPGEKTQADLKKAIGELPAGQQDSAFGAIGSFKNAKDIMDLLNKGVKTGPLAGRGQSAEQLFGRASEDFNKFKAATTAFTANYIKALSGVQVSDRERQFLMSALPSPNLQENVNRANLEMLLEFLKNKYELQLGVNFEDFPTEIPSIKTQSVSVPSDVQSLIGQGLSEKKSLETIRRDLANIYGRNVGYQYLDVYMQNK